MAVTCQQQFEEIGAQMAPLAVYILEQLGVDPGTLGPRPASLLCRIANNAPDPHLQLSPPALKFYRRLSWFLETVADNLPDGGGHALVRPPGMAKRPGG